MQKYTFLFILFIFSFYGFSQENNQELKIKKVIDTFFEGLHKGDSSIVSKTLHKNVKIQTTNTLKEGKKILIDESRSKLLKTIASKNQRKNSSRKSFLMISKLVEI